MSHTNQIQNILHRHTLWLYYFNRLNTAHRNDQKTLNCFRLSSQCASSETHSKDLGKGFSFRQLNINLVFNLFSTELQCYINFFSQGTIQIMRDKKAWFFLVKVDKNVIKALYGKVSQLYKYMYMRSKGVAVVRALASHQRGPGLNLGVNAIMWVEFVVRSLPNCSEGFFFLLKNQHFQIPIRSGKQTCFHKFSWTLKCSPVNKLQLQCTCCLLAGVLSNSSNRDKSFISLSLQRKENVKIKVHWINIY